MSQSTASFQQTTLSAGLGERNARRKVVPAGKRTLIGMLKSILDGVSIQPAKEISELIVVRQFLINGFRTIDGRWIGLNFR
jgi:hypothetical protein